MCIFEFGLNCPCKTHINCSRGAVVLLRFSVCVLMCVSSLHTRLSTCFHRLRPGIQTGQKVCHLRSKLLLRFPVRVSPPLIHLQTAVAGGNRSLQQEAGTSDRAGCQATGGQSGL